jgi:hypothetical protein
MHIGPGIARQHQPQPPEAEIRHSPRRSADILAKLRFHQHHDRPAERAPLSGMVGSGSRHSLLGGATPAASGFQSIEQFNPLWQGAPGVAIGPERR